MTNDAKKTFAVICWEYKRRVESGTPKDEAIEFESSQVIENKASQLRIQDVSSALGELSDAGYITVNIADGFSLENKGIEFKEQLPLKAVKEIAGFIAKLIP